MDDRVATIVSKMLRLVVYYVASATRPPDPLGAKSGRLYYLPRLAQLLSCYRALVGPAPTQELRAWEDFYKWACEDTERSWQLQGDSAALDGALEWEVTIYRQIVLDVLVPVLVPPLRREVSPYEPDLDEDVSLEDIGLENDLDTLNCIAHARGKAQAIVDFLERHGVRPAVEELAEADAALRCHCHLVVARFLRYGPDVLPSWEEEQRQACFPEEWWWHYPSMVAGQETG